MGDLLGDIIAGRRRVLNDSYGPRPISYMVFLRPRL